MFKITIDNLKSTISKIAICIIFCKSIVFSALIFHYVDSTYLYLKKDTLIFAKHKYDELKKLGVVKIISNKYWCRECPKAERPDRRLFSSLLTFLLEGYIF